MTMRDQRRYDYAKRSADVVGAVIALIVTSPIQLVLACLVVANVGRPVLFRQPRPGRGGKVFLLFKLRTMREADAGSGLVTDADRLTALGRLLRSTSLDELPSLFNVLRGDMSFIGPRPLLVSYLERYTPTQARRHEVRPGITGLAQVSGRNALSWEKRFEFDVYYVDHRSLFLDLSILGRTARSVLMREGITAADSATMHEFTGTDESTA